MKVHQTRQVMMIDCTMIYVLYKRKVFCTCIMYEMACLTDQWFKLNIVRTKFDMSVASRRDIHQIMLRVLV